MRFQRLVRPLPAIGRASAVLTGLVAPRYLAAATLLSLAVTALRQSLVATGVLETSLLLLLALAAAILLLFQGLLLPSSKSSIDRSKRSIGR